MHSENGNRLALFAIVCPVLSVASLFLFWFRPGPFLLAAPLLLIAGLVTAIASLRMKRSKMAVRALLLGLFVLLCYTIALLGIVRIFDGGQHPFGRAPPNGHERSQ